MTNDYPEYAVILKELNEKKFAIVNASFGSEINITTMIQCLYTKRYGKIGCSQRRDVGAISLAHIVAERMSLKLGIDVGYVTSYEQKASDNTTIKFMSDYILLKEFLFDPKLILQYSILIIEAHTEITVLNELLFSHLKTLG